MSNFFQDKLLSLAGRGGVQTLIRLMLFKIRENPLLMGNGTEFSLAVHYDYPKQSKLKALKTLDEHSFAHWWDEGL